MVRGGVEESCGAFGASDSAVETDFGGCGSGAPEWIADEEGHDHDRHRARITVRRLMDFTTLRGKQMQRVKWKAQVLCLLLNRLSNISNMYHQGSDNDEMRMYLLGGTASHIYVKLGRMSSVLYLND